jgi:hypothetical protein
VLKCIRVAEKREGTGFAGTVAGRTTGDENGSDLLIVSNPYLLGISDLRRNRAEQDSSKERNYCRSGKYHEAVFGCRIQAMRPLSASHVAAPKS